ncbi:hypothetical protein ABTY61_40960 [Kitasatospora sp. NPDC096128]|uniref:hypothetical protein n=1 Tax=Kitasatospora sp. NPDC096128 TaxID=3155547 RepID=UPI0033222402
MASKGALLTVGIAAVLALGPASTSGAAVSNVGDDRWGVSLLQPALPGDHHFGLRASAAVTPQVGTAASTARLDDDRWG